MPDFTSEEVAFFKWLLSDLTVSEMTDGDLIILMSLRKKLGIIVPPLTNQ
jgi:hypothetical protein